MPYEDLLEKHAGRTGVDQRWLARIMQIESGGRPGVVTGSYKGLFQLSESEFRKHGGSGDIFDPDANISAAANKIARESLAFKAKYGKDPTLADIYMIHQQGTGGYDAHTRNPDELAWKNMYSTGEGRAKGEAWAKRAIWGNVPDQYKARYGSVENMTSKDFMDMWSAKIGGGDISVPRIAREAKAAGGEAVKEDKVKFLTSPEPTKGTFLGFSGGDEAPPIQFKLPIINPPRIPLGGKP